MGDSQVPALCLGTVMAMLCRLATTLEDFFPAPGFPQPGIVSKLALKQDNLLHISYSL